MKANPVICISSHAGWTTRDDLLFFSRICFAIVGMGGSGFTQLIVHYLFMRYIRNYSIEKYFIWYEYGGPMHDNITWVTFKRSPAKIWIPFVHSTFLTLATITANRVRLLVKWTPTKLILHMYHQCHPVGTGFLVEQRQTFSNPIMNANEASIRSCTSSIGHGFIATRPLRQPERIETIIRPAREGCRVQAPGFELTGGWGGWTPPPQPSKPTILVKI